MRRIFLRYPNKTQRFFEIAIPSVSWFIITMPLWLSFWHPALVAYLIITFDVYWFYKSVSLVIYALRSFVMLTAHSAVNWLEQARNLPNFQELWHVVIIPEFQEPIHILRRTLDNLSHQDYPRERMIIILATETKRSQQPGNRFTPQTGVWQTFGHFLITRHTLVSGEIAGKSSNMAWAARKAAVLLKTKRIPIAWTTVTSCDADALPHPKYFSALAYQFLSDPYRHDHFYQEASCFITISGASRSQPVSQYAKQHVESRISFPTIAAHQFLDVFPFISDGGICRLLGGRCDSGRLSHVFYGLFCARRTGIRTPDFFADSC